MATDYSSVYTIKDFYQKVLPMYFNKDQLELSTVGALGMFIDVNSSTTEDMMNVASRYITEIMPGQAELPDFVYSQAANYGITNVLAQPSRMSLLLLVKEDDVIENAVRNGDHLEFTLDADMNILVGDISFSIPYDIKIRSTLFKEEYNHMAYYDVNYNNEIVDNDIPFIKTMKTVINDDIWLVLRTNVYQYRRVKVQVSITTNSILNIPYIDQDFSDQLCNFEVFYTPAGSSTPTQLQKKAEGQQPILNPFIYYRLSDDNTLRLSFANDDRYFVPGYNSNITIYLYETVGEAGNFPFSKEGIDVYVTGDTENEDIAYNRSIFPMGLSQGNAIGGSDQLTLENVKKLTTEKQITVNSYTTNNDLNVYFNNYASIYNHDAIFQKQRDDYVGREYGCFIKLNDGTNIIPTNTVNLRIGTAQTDAHIPTLRQFIVKPGTVFKYETESELDTIVRKEDVDVDDINYALAPLMVITTKPNKVNYYMTTIDKNIEVDYSYFNLDSIFNFVSKSCTITRNAIKGDESYHIDLQLARVDGVFNDLQSSDFMLQSKNGEIDVNKLEVLIIFDTSIGNYVRMKCNTVNTEDGEYLYDFSADVHTNDTIDDNRILITELLKREDDTTDERLIDMVNPKIKFAVFYDYGEDESHDYKDISVVSSYTLCNIYEPRDGELYFAYPLDLMRSHVVFEDDPGSEFGYNFFIKQVPVFGKDYLFNSPNIDKIINDITTDHTFLTDLISSLHGLFTINMKFYNTYGRARSFMIGCGKSTQLINHVNCKIQMGIKFYDGILTEDYMNLIKTYIKNYLEKINALSSGSNQAFISVLDYQLHVNFKDQIKYSIFYSLNDYDSRYQTIENEIIKGDITDPTYIPEYLTITTDDIDITAL